MPSPRVPIIETIWKSWADAFRAIRAMPVVALCALVITAVIGVTAWWVSVAVLLNPGRTVDEWLTSPSWFVLVLVNTSLQIVLLAPLAIAVQRFLIRGDIARWYPLNPLRPSYLSYVGTALAINLAFRLPDLIRILVADDSHPLPVALGLWLLMLGLMIAVLVVALRRIALFAAIAVNAPNATWRAVAPVDAGNTFRIVLIALCIWLPGAIYGVLVQVYFPVPLPSDRMGQVVRTLVIWLPELLIICAFAAAGARIYTALEGSAEAPASRDERPVVA